MGRLIACLMFMIATVPATDAAATSRADACETVAAYFDQVDATIDDGMAALAAQPGFPEAIESAMAANDRNGPGFLALPATEQQALLAYLRMPAESLADMDDEVVADQARDLQNSAEAYWGLMADMMQATAEEGPSAAIPYVDGLDRATRENLAAQADLMASCPDEVAAWADASGVTAPSGEGTPAAGATIAWERHLAGESEGLGYPVLFFAADLDATPEASASVSRA